MELWPSNEPQMTLAHFILAIALTVFLPFAAGWHLAAAIIGAVWAIFIGVWIPVIQPVLAPPPRADLTPAEEASAQEVEWLKRMNSGLDQTTVATLYRRVAEMEHAMESLKKKGGLV